MKTVKLQKIGNSHMVTIPYRIVKQAGLKVGEPIALYSVERKIYIEPVEKKKKIPIEKLKVYELHGKHVDHQKIMRWREEARYDR